jgi:hypothetical protein
MWEQNLARMRGTVREGVRALLRGKKPRMRWGVLSLLVGVTLFCLGILLSLLATVFEVSFGAAGEDVGLVDGEALAPLTVYQSHPLTPAEEARDTDERPVNASVLTMLVVGGACSGVSILWLLTTSAWRRGAIRPSWDAQEDRRWSRGAYDGLSFLGVFVL